MKRLLLLFGALFSMSQMAGADGGPPTLSWKGWAVSSSEVWNLDAGPQPQFPLRYPLTNLFDGDAATTWAFEDGQRRNIKTRPGPDWRPSLTIRPEKPVVMDSLWLMNGYNRRHDLFLRNDRIVRIVISVNGKPVKDTFLSDSMGWHKISLPRQSVNSLDIFFTGIRKGSGPDNDLCVSELAFFDQGRQIDLQMPQAAVYSLRYCCGGIGYLLRRGQIVTQGGLGEGGQVIWNPAGNLVAGLDGRQGRNWLWVADARRARVKRTFPIPEDHIYAMDWKSNRTVQLTFYDFKTKRKHPKQFTL